jgi:hypothetical protein
MLRDKSNVRPVEQSTLAIGSAWNTVRFLSAFFEIQFLRFYASH